MMKKVDYYYNTTITGTTTSLLETCFAQATEYQERGFFENIYIPVKIVSSSGIADNYSYINIGLTDKDIADIYYAQYSGNYLIDVKLAQRMQAIFKKNLGKYLKLLELQGYEYNPLWNVDGEEIRQNLENRGTNDIAFGGVTSDFGDEFTAIRTEHRVSGFNSNGYVDGSYDESYGVPQNSAGVGHQEVRMDPVTGNMVVTGVDAPSNAATSHRGSVGTKNTTTYTHNTAKNIVDGNEVEYVVSANDTAFGTTLVCGDKMFVEKYLRHGNIGVTKTTELIESQRNIVKYILLQEFFDDINEVILIGLYGNY